VALEQDTTALDENEATELVRAALGTGLTVTGVRRLHGGTVNSVLELMTDGDPQSLVAKLRAEPGCTGFEWEHAVLEWVREHTEFPMPRSYGCDVTGRTFAGSYILIERLPGVTLDKADLRPDEKPSVEREIAEHVAALHSHRRATYGSALRPAEEGWTRWLDRFGPRIRREYGLAGDRLTRQARDTAERAIENLAELLPECGDPRLAHNDLWAGNIMIDRDAGGRPRVSGFIDVIEDQIGAADYIDPEYELSYLLCFRTVGDEFLDIYGRAHPLRDGFETRSLVYRLCNLMLHMRLMEWPIFTEGAEELAAELAKRLG
jgi:fructosamine-3-kinase